MAKPLLNKNISPACEYCKHGTASKYTDEVFCLKKGVTNKQDACRHYKYDVLKRTPKRINPTGEFTAEDFEI